MEAAVAVEVPAVEVRERLVGFVEEVAARLPLRRQRENALLYVRGLVEQGGRKSLQPTLFRLEETPARYESVQQFLADSPWDPELLVRACAERVAPRDRRCRLGGRRHRDRQGRQALAGGEAAVLGHAGQDRQLPDHASACTRSASGGRCRSAGGCICPRSGATTCARRRKAKIPDEVVLRDEAAARGRALRAGGRLGAAGGADPGRLGLRRRHRLPHAAGTSSELEYVVAVRGGDERLRAGDDLRRARAQRHDRPAAHGRPPRPQARVGARARRAAAGDARGRRCPAGRHRRARTSRAASPSSASSPPTRSETGISRRARSG